MSVSSVLIASGDAETSSPPKKAVNPLDNAARLCYNALSEQGISCRMAPPHLVMQSAVSVALEAEALAKDGCLATAQDLQPVYLRPAQAQRLRDRV